MKLGMFSEIHDSQVLAYSADSRSSEVLLHLRAGPEGSPLFALRFSGVVAHQFPYPLMPSWVLDLAPVPAEELLARDWEAIVEGFRLVGWPGSWADSLGNAQAYCRAEGVSGYDLATSYGMTGWVLAKAVERI
jgi:hypothetical protein